MIRNIVQVVLAGSLIAGVASCKKKGGESGAAASSEEAKSTGIPECDALIKADEKFVQCDKLPPEQKKAYASAFENDKRSYVEAKDKGATAEQCKKAMSDLVDGAKYRNCPLD